MGGCDGAGTSTAATQPLLLLPTVGSTYNRYDHNPLLIIALDSLSEFMYWDFLTRLSQTEIKFIADWNSVYELNTEFLLHFVLRNFPLMGNFLFLHQEWVHFSFSTENGYSLHGPWMNDQIEDVFGSSSPIEGLQRSAWSHFSEQTCSKFTRMNAGTGGRDFETPRSHLCHILCLTHVIHITLKFAYLSLWSSIMNSILTDNANRAIQGNVAM